MKNSIFKIYYLGFFILLSACVPNFSCDRWANDFKNHQHFNLVLNKKKNYHSNDVYFYGMDLVTKSKTDVYDGSGWIELNFDKFLIGDTVIKPIGKYTITIKRKNKTILIPFECSGKIYVDR